MSEYTFDFPNMDATPAGKDGQDITEEQTLFQETYENQGWLFEYGEEGFYRYHWEIDDGLPYIVYISQSIKFPDHSDTSTGKDGENISEEQTLLQETYENQGWGFEHDTGDYYLHHWVIDESLPHIISRKFSYEFPNMDATPTGKDGQDASIFDLIEKEIYENNGWDFNEIWELPLHDQEEGIFYLPNLQGLEHSYLHEELVSLFAFVIYVYNKHNDEIISIDIYILMQTGTIVIKPARLKGYEAFEKEKQVVVDELGKSIDVVFNYYIKPQHLADEHQDLSLTIANIDRKRDRYKVQKRLLSGRYVVQTIDKGKGIWNIKFYATAEQKRKLNEYFATNEIIEYVKNLEVTKLRIKKLDWNTYVNGNYQERIYEGQMEATEVIRNE